MVRSVIDEMLKHLPERRGLRDAGSGGVLDNALDVGVRERRDVAEQIVLDFKPAAAERIEVREIAAGRNRVVRTAAPAFEPQPFDAGDVRERVADGAEARAEVACELLVIERRTSVEDAMVGPGIVIVEKAKIVGVHRALLLSLFRCTTVGL